MDVALPANGPRVAEPVRDPVDDLIHGPFRLAFGLRQRPLSEKSGCADGPAPCAEMLGREVSAGRLADIIVDVLRPDRAAVAILVDVLEEILAGQVLCAANDPCDAPVGQLQSPLLARLSHERKTHCRTGDLDMPVAQRSEAETVVVARM